MLTKEECREALKILSTQPDESFCNGSICGVSDCGYCPKNTASKLLKHLIDDHFSNPPLKCEERVKFLEKQLDIAIKELCIDAKGADACNSLDALYEGIKERIEEQARKEVVNK